MQIIFNVSLSGEKGLILIGWKSCLFLFLMESLIGSEDIFDDGNEGNIGIAEEVAIGDFLVEELEHQM